MTLSQLQTFALVARLGSMRAAAAALGVSEPAVSAAIAALRQDLGEALVVRAAGGIALTAAGRRLAAYADEIVGLAERARQDVATAGAGPDLLRVAATAVFEEHAATGLVDAFTRRSPGLSVELVHELPERLTESLVNRSADVVLGLRPTTVTGLNLELVPFLRYQRVLVAAAERRIGAGAPSLAELVRQPWLAGPAGVEELSEEGRWLAGLQRLPTVTCLSSETEALGAVLEGGGVMLALGHVVREHLRAGQLVRLAAPGTPIRGLWFASTLGDRRAAPAARSLLRFVTTPDATAAMMAASGTPRPARPLPPVHVTLWS